VEDTAHDAGSEVENLGFLGVSAFLHLLLSPQLRSTRHLLLPFGGLLPPSAERRLERRLSGIRHRRQVLSHPPPSALPL